MAGAAAVWTVSGANGRLDQATGVTDARGELSAIWVLGTRAADAQGLTVQVAAGKHKATMSVPAVAKPVEVSSIAFTAHDTAVVKLGVATTLAVQATDPFGNRFAPSATRFVSLDTSLCSIDSLGSVRARKRGFGRVVVLAGSAADTAWVHPTQVVQTIVATPNTLRFHSLGQTATLSVQLLDDQGLSVHDSLPVDSVAVDTVVKVQAGTTYTIRSISNGVTPVILRAGLTAQTVQVVVSQRIASVKLSAGRVNFDALGDTVQWTTTVSDSLGAPLANQVLAYSAGDTSVVTIGPSGLVTSKSNGSTWIHATALNGVADSVPIVVAQQVARVVAKRDTILLEALKAALAIQATPLDRLGSPVVNATVSYSSGAQSIATVDASGNVRAVANGTTVVTAASAGDTSFVAVRVAQRPVKLVVSPDTMRFVAFGDTSAVTAVALDSLGSLVPGSTTMSVPDSSVVARVDSVRVRARGNGVTSATVGAAGLSGQLAIVVNQVPTTLNVIMWFNNPVLTLPTGAPLPVTCQVFDKNGFSIARDPAFVGSVRGTVTGTRCGDAQIAHSGYDTLSFALGTTRARVPVIVSTRPDSVGVLAAAQPLTDDVTIRYVGEDLSNPSILALRPLVQDILAAYGNPATNLGRARAIRDWVARTAVYPVAWVHPDGSTSNLSVLPPGNTWADVNATLSTEQWNRDSDYWMYLSSDGYAMLDRLLGTLDPGTGLRADDGLMVHVAGAQYRMRDLQSYRYLLCTYQTVIASTLWAAAGLHGMLVQILAHEPAAVFIPELGRWVYEDVSFSDDYLLDGAGDPLSPSDLLDLGTSGMSSRARESKLPGPNYDPQVYIDGRTYMDVVPQGMVVMGSRLYMNDVANPTAWTGYIGMIDVPELANYPEFKGPRVTRAQAFPTLGVVVDDVQADDSVFVVRLGSTFPNHDHFERRTNGGPWVGVTSVDVLPVGACRVEYRSLDAVGNISASAVLDVWVPRAQAFVQSGDPGGTRRLAQYCM